MRVDLRVKHDIEARKAAIELFERGHGSKSTAKTLSAPRNTVRQWLYVYRSLGNEVPLFMDGKRARHTYWARRTSPSRWASSPSSRDRNRWKYVSTTGETAFAQTARLFSETGEK